MHLWGQNESALLYSSNRERYTFFLALFCLETVYGACQMHIIIYLIMFIRSSMVIIIIMLCTHITFHRIFSVGQYRQCHKRLAHFLHTQCCNLPATDLYNYRGEICIIICWNVTSKCLNVEVEYLYRQWLGYVHSFCLL